MQQRERKRIMIHRKLRGTWDKETERDCVSWINDRTCSGEWGRLRSVPDMMNPETDNLKPVRSDLHTEMENLPEKLPTQLRNQICSYLSSCCHCTFLRMWHLYLKLPRPVPLLWAHAGWLWQIKAPRYMAITFGGWREARQRGGSWGKRGTETNRDNHRWMMGHIRRDSFSQGTTTEYRRRLHALKTIKVIMQYLLLCSNFDAGNSVNCNNN